MVLTKLLFVLPLLLQPTETPLDAMADRVVEQINEQEKQIAGAYSKGFLQQVPEGQLIQLYKGYFAQHGRIIGLSPRERTQPETGVFTLAYEKGVEMQMTLTIDKQSPPKVIGLWFGPAAPSFKDIPSVIQAIKKLPGSVNFQVARLGDDIEVLHELNADKVLAIGSAFKLYLLGAIVEKGVSWADVVELRSEHKSIPTGVLQDWPDGALVTVHTLALQMISISDNTATDHLLHYLGRRTVESHLSAMGHRAPERTWPLLTTMEMFKIKSDRRLLREYVKADVAKRRTLLDQRVRKMSREIDNPYSEGTPVAIDTVEWFASASDLCRAMDWFRRRNDENSLGILAINSAVPFMKGEFDYVGYKGGSEPGVLNFTWLLRTKKGEHLALSMGWNHPGSDGVELETFLGLAQSTLRLLASR